MAAQRHIPRHTKRAQDLTPWSHLRNTNYFPDGFQLGIRYISHAEAIAWHDHDFYEIVFVADGSGVHKVASQKTRIRRNDVYIIPPGVYHRYDTPRHLSIVNIIFAPSFLTGINVLLKGAPLTDVMRTARRAKSGVLIHLDADSFRDVKASVEAMLREYSYMRTGYREALSAHLAVLLICLNRTYATGEPSRKRYSGHMDAGSNAVIGRAQSYITEHLSEAMHGNDLAETVSLHPSYFSRLFKTHTGYGVTEYINEARIKKACEMLEATENRIIDIALAVGYNSISHFNRMFRTRMKMTPNRYRRLRGR